MPYCPDCGAAVEEADRHCAQCGARLDGGPPAPPGDAYYIATLVLALVTVALGVVWVLSGVTVVLVGVPVGIVISLLTMYLDLRQLPGNLDGSAPRDWVISAALLWVLTMPQYLYVRKKQIG